MDKKNLVEAINNFCGNQEYCDASTYNFYLSIHPDRQGYERLHFIAVEYFPDSTKRVIIDSSVLSPEIFDCLLWAEAVDMSLSDASSFGLFYDTKSIRTLEIYVDSIMIFYGGIACPDSLIRKMIFPVKWNMVITDKDKNIIRKNIKEIKY